MFFFFFSFSLFFFFFFKQKTAYEIYQCDWSSDVCSSDLDGGLALFSTPLGVSGKLWDAFNSVLYKTLQLPSGVNRYLSESHLEKQKQSMSALSFETEYMAQFMDIQNNFFSLPSIQGACRDYDLAIVKEPGKIYSLGIDWGRTRDSSVLTVVSREPSGLLKLEYVKALQGVPFPEQLSHVRYLNNHFKFSRIVSEYAGLGIGPSDSLIAEGFPVLKFTPTVDEKLKAYDHLKLKLETRELTLPAGELKLLTELKFFQFQVTPSGKITLHHPGGGSDDYADSFCFAVWAFKVSAYGPEAYARPRALRYR